MTIEIHRPEIEALILQRMEIGGFQDVEEVLLHALKSAPLPEPSFSQLPVYKGNPRKNLGQFLLDSPLPGSGLEIERIRDFPRPIDL
jgi:hypothetical protein